MVEEVVAGRDFLAVLQSGEPAVVFAYGEIDLASAQSLATVVAQACEVSFSVAIDLSGTTFIDASGLDVIAEAEARCRDELQVRGASPSVARLFQLVELGHLLAA